MHRLSLPSLTLSSLSLFICCLGCVEVVELEQLESVQKTERSLIEAENRLTDENNSQCVLNEIKCEQQCFYDHGQLVGTLSPFYNSCMSRCEDELNECLQSVRVLAPTKTDQVTYSWEQPPSEGIGGYYGYCGPTAAANLVTNICGHRVTPMKFAEESFGLGPGTHPQTLSHALNELGCCGEWSVCEHDPSRVDVFQELQKNLPAAVMLNWTARSLHWITVMQVNYSPSCEVIYNHWGGQATMDCNQFLERWALTESSLGQTSIVSRLLRPFTYVCQVSPQPSDRGECR